MKLLARANVKHGGEAKLDTISGQIRTIKVATMVRPGELFDVENEKDAERLIADGVAVDPKEASKDEKNGLPRDERARILREELAELELEDPANPQSQDIRTHRAQQAEENVAIEAAQKAEKGKGRKGADDDEGKGKSKTVER